MSENFDGIEQRRKPRTMVSEISFNRFGGPTYPRQQTVVAGLVQTILVPSNPNRVTMILTNNSATDIYLGFTPDVAVGTGLILAANGGTFSMNIGDEGEAVTHQLYAIAGAAALNCTLIETLLQVR